MLNVLMAAFALVVLTASQAGQPSFASRVDVVSVPVSVTYLPGVRAELMGAADFRVFEDGVEQRVELVSSDPGPMSVCILLDASASFGTATKRRLAIDLARGVFNALAPGDEVSLVVFNDRPRVAVPWRRVGDPFGVDWESFKPAGQTAIADALRAGLAQMDGASRRRELVLITDGADNASRVSMQSLARTRRQSEASLYVLSVDVAGEVPPVIVRGAPLLPRLTDESGGTFYGVSDATSAPRAVSRLMADLRSQYLIGFTPSKPFDGKYRRLKVESTRPSIRVTHRAGYLALPAQ